MQNTESGRKLNQAMVSTGRAVATTGKAVGKLKRKNNFNTDRSDYIRRITNTNEFQAVQYHRLKEHFQTGGQH